MRPCAGLGERQCGQSVAEPPTLPVPKAMLQPHPWVLGLSTMISCLFIVAIWSSCEGTKVENSVFGHLDDVTPSL